jgi:hypothetical protein
MDRRGDVGRGSQVTGVQRRVTNREAVILTVLTAAIMFVIGIIFTT